MDPLADHGQFFENAPCGYLVLDATGRVFSVNGTFLRWTGYAPGSLAGRHLRDLMTVAGRIFYETNFAPLLRLQGGFEEVALDFLTAAGEKLPVLVNAVERRAEDGHVVAIWVVVFRAKERRGYERDLRSRESAAVEKLRDEEATSQLREQFIAVLGHDLRSPLASIVGAARLLRREVQSDKALRILQLMETSVDRMAGLIDDVMDFARGRLGGGIDLHLTLAPLEPVLRQIVAEIETSEPSRIIECEINLSHRIEFDERRIGQLVSNLLANALTHGAPKQPVYLRAAVEGGTLVLSVANAGEPITPAAMERLFQPFFRGEVRPSKQGLGLGLHIASEIAKAHKGTLQVHSDVTETRFTLLMPVRKGGCLPEAVGPIAP